MKEGLGDIQIDFESVVPNGGGDRRLTFENRHRSGISVYLVNAVLVEKPACSHSLADWRIAHRPRLIILTCTSSLA
ncbi:MAG: hypothetical protein ABI877_10500 [Gemmatimonadaceae bacterium]